MRDRETIKKNRRKAVKQINDLEEFVNLLNEIGKRDIDPGFGKITANELLKFSFSDQLVKHYRTFSIPQKSGGVRKIDAPLPRIIQYNSIIKLNGD